jgi:predicted negative regulator of RcsB-dependent stress response
MNEEINQPSAGANLKIFIISSILIVGLVFAWVYMHSPKESSGLSVGNKHDISFNHVNEQQSGYLAAATTSELSAQATRSDNADSVSSMSQAALTNNKPTDSAPASSDNSSASHSVNNEDSAINGNKTKESSIAWPRGLADPSIPP